MGSFSRQPESFDIQIDLSFLPKIQLKLLDMTLIFSFAARGSLYTMYLKDEIADCAQILL